MCLEVKPLALCETLHYQLTAIHDIHPLKEHANLASIVSSALSRVGRPLFLREVVDSPTTLAMLTITHTMATRIWNRTALL